MLLIKAIKGICCSARMIETTLVLWLCLTNLSALMVVRFLCHFPHYAMTTAVSVDQVQGERPGLMRRGMLSYHASIMKGCCCSPTI